MLVLDRLFLTFVRCPQCIEIPLTSTPEAGERSLRPLAKNAMVLKSIFASGYKARYERRAVYATN